MVSRAELRIRWETIRSRWTGEDPEFRDLIAEIRATAEGRDLLWLAEYFWRSYGIAPPWILPLDAQAPEIPPEPGKHPGYPVTPDQDLPGFRGQGHLAPP